MFKINVLENDIYVNVTKIGQDYQVSIYGGEEPHIGCVVLAEPYWKAHQVHASMSVVNRREHRDDVIASRYAKELCVYLGTTIAVNCGIHYECLSKEEILTICNACDALLEKIKETLKNG